MFKFIKAMAEVAKDEAPVQDCGCGCRPRKAQVVSDDNKYEEDGGCCGPRKSPTPNGVPSCGDAPMASKPSCGVKDDQTE